MKELKDKSEIKKILVIKPGAIGDVLMTTPLLANLRFHFPQAQINYLTKKFCKDALSGNPNVDKILTYDLETDSSYCILKNIRKQRYDLVVDLFCNPRTALITFYSGAKYKVGYKFRHRTYAYNIRITPRSSEVHNIEFNLDSIRALGLEVITNKPLMAFSGIEEEFADKYFKKNNLTGKKVIAINPCGSWETKVWHKEKFIELIKEFKLLGKDFSYLILWGYESERKVAEEIKSQCGESVLVIPELNFKYMIAIIKKCDVLITNDTGPMHGAWMTGVKTVAIFGPTNSHLQGPLSDNSIVIKNETLNCLGCNLTKLSECKYEHACMKELSPDKIIEAVRNLLESKELVGTFNTG